MSDRITLEPGRLALRKPELGPLLIVTVEEADPDCYYLNERGESVYMYRSDFLPVLRPGDVVPAGSLLLNPFTERTWTLGNADMESVFRHGGDCIALLRYGPEEDA